ncbi:MAG: TIGR01244 family sulfur transferase [Marinomonas sp.]
MSDFRKLSETMLASPQIGPDEVATAAEQGVKLIVNNRPDGESPDEPQGPEIEAAAAAAGIGYLAIPIGQSGFSLPQVDALVEAIKSADGPVLGYCRSGTRSTFLWSLARAKMGDAPEAIAAAAGAAGYDISPVRPTVDMLAGDASGDS